MDGVLNNWLHDCTSYLMKGRCICLIVEAWDSKTDYSLCQGIWGVFHFSKSPMQDFYYDLWTFTVSLVIYLQNSKKIYNIREFCKTNIPSVSFHFSKSPMHDFGKFDQTYIEKYQYLQWMLVFFSINLVKL